MKTKNAEHIPQTYRKRPQNDSANLFAGYEELESTPLDKRSFKYGFRCCIAESEEVELQKRKSSLTLVLNSGIIQRVATNTVKYVPIALGVVFALSGLLYILSIALEFMSTTCLALQTQWTKLVQSGTWKLPLAILLVLVVVSLVLLFVRAGQRNATSFEDKGWFRQTSGQKDNAWTKVVHEKYERTTYQK